MVRSLFAGSTNYSHQSIKDICIDLKELIKNIDKTTKLLKKSFQNLQNQDCISKIPDDFIFLISESFLSFETFKEELGEILHDIKYNEIRSDHITRLKRIVEVCRELNEKYSLIWNVNYDHKEHDKKYFYDVEKLYSEGRRQIVDILDLSSLSFRLQDFVGRKKPMPIITIINYLLKIGDFLKRFWSYN
jgi:hypothetical protein